MPDQAMIERHFREVAERMADLPICNPALAVEVVGWQAVADTQLGVLITQWCMNLLWQVADADWPGKGERLVLALPSGDYEGTAHEAPPLGRYASASLCSPMQDFQDQPHARAMAEEVLRLVLAVPTPPVERPAGVSRRGLLRRALGQESA